MPHDSNHDIDVPVVWILDQEPVEDDCDLDGSPTMPATPRALLAAGQDPFRFFN